MEMYIHIFRDCVLAPYTRFHLKGCFPPITHSKTAHFLVCYDRCLRASWEVMELAHYFPFTELYSYRTLFFVLHYCIRSLCECQCSWHPLNPHHKVQKWGVKVRRDLLLTYLLRTCLLYELLFVPLLQQSKDYGDLPQRQGYSWVGLRDSW